MTTIPGTAYKHNNSGGSNWLSREQWDRLRQAGWSLFTFDGPVTETPENVNDLCGATTTLPREVAEFEWVQLTNEDSTQRGCSCCGAPHYFYSITDVTNLYS